MTHTGWFLEKSPELLERTESKGQGDELEFMMCRIPLGAGLEVALSEPGLPRLQCVTGKGAPL